MPGGSVAFEQHSSRAIHVGGKFQCELFILCYTLWSLGVLLHCVQATIDAIEDVNSRCINSTEQLPLDLAVKCGICKAYIAEMDQAQAHFARLTTEDVALYPDLYLDVAEALLALNLHGRALSFYEQLLSLP